MAVWRWAVGPWRAGNTPQAELTTATGNRRLICRLLDPSEAQISLNGYGSDAQLIDELITDLWVYRDGVSLFRGRVYGPTSDHLSAATYTYDVKAFDYRQLLWRRLLYADRTWANTEQTVIAWNLIQDTQNQLGGDMGIRSSLINPLSVGWPSTGVNRPSVIFTAGSTVWDSLRKLNQMANGFDLDIDQNRVANLYYPQRGADNGVVLDYGGVLTAVERTFEPATFANAIRQSGASGVTTVTTTVPNIAITPEGRWDAQYGDIDLTTADMVAQTSATNIALASTALPTYQLHMARGAWGGPSHFWLGDYVLVVIQTGRLNEVVKGRVFQMDISVGSSDTEDVIVTVGNLHHDIESVLKGLAKRIIPLTRR